MGIPSSDVAPKGEFALAHESQGNVFESGGYWNSFTFATYGLGKGWELASSLYGLSRPTSPELALGMGFKKRYLVRGEWAKRHEVTVAGGAMVPVSFRGNGVGLWAYGLASVRVPRTRTRLTAGPSWGTRQIFGRTVTKAMVGVEQPLTKKVSLVADWFTGTHDLAAAIFGVSYQPRPDLLIITGWKAANNAGSGKPAMMLEVAYIFGHKKTH
ncbi:MAG: hypothetical protein NTV52_18415 [Acidobacteria bacterium]|nr:hypothetical protein [Acidobacteriota bacterium]